MRIYFALRPGSVLPDLALVNVIECKDSYSDTNGDILVSNNHERGNEWCNGDSVYNWVQNWVDTIGGQDSLYVPVYGYNYDWDVIWDAAIDHKSRDTVGLSIRQVLHAVSPYDTSYQHPPAQPGEDPGIQMAGYLAYNLLLTHVNDTAGGARNSYDFSMPCPRLCGDLSDTSRVSH